MGVMDLRPLEFEAGLYIVGEMISNDPTLSDIQRGVLDLFVVDPALFLSAGKDDPGAAVAGHVRNWMYATLARAPEQLYNKLRALDSTAMRFGTWGWNPLRPEFAGMDFARLDYEVRHSAEQVDRTYEDLRRRRMDVLPLDDELVPKIFAGLEGHTLISTVALVDLYNGYMVWSPIPPPYLLEDLFEDVFDKDPPAFTKLGLERNHNEINVTMDRYNPAFDPFEPYARHVEISAGDESGIDILLHKTRRPDDVPLLYKFEDGAGRWSPLPDGDMWRVEATLRDEADLDGMIHGLDVEGIKLFLQGPSSLHRIPDMVIDADFRAGQPIGVFGSGYRAPIVLTNIWHKMHGGRLRGSGGGRTCGITSRPMLPRALTGLRPASATLASGLMTGGLR